MNKCIGFIVFALIEVFCFSLASCVTDDDDGTTDEVPDVETQKTTGSDKETCKTTGVITVSDVSGNVLYVDSVIDSRGNGFRIWASEIDEPRTLTCIALLKPEGGFPLNVSDKRLSYIRINVQNYEKVAVGYLKDRGYAKIHYYKNSGGYYEASSITDYFYGDVSIVAFEPNYITIKFTNCWLTSYKAYFNGEIKFGINWENDFIN